MNSDFLWHSLHFLTTSYTQIRTVKGRGLKNGLLRLPRVPISRFDFSPTDVMCLVLCRWRKANWRDLWREETWKYGEARLPSSKLHFALTRFVEKNTDSFRASDWAVDDTKKIESVTIRITWWFQSMRACRTLTIWQQGKQILNQTRIFIAFQNMT